MKKFTFIEFLVVVAIVGILLAMIVPMITSHISTNTKVEYKQPGVIYNMAPK